MFTRILSFLVKALLIFLVVAILLTFLPRLITGWYARNRLVEVVPETDPKPVAIVFGAGLQRDGRPSRVLRDRISTAVELYLAGKVDKLLMSGDNRFAEYNEPGAMRDFAISLGVPEQDIVLDFAGRRTYDTCYRAREIFQLGDVYLVTQRYHLPRALYTCNVLEVEAVGVPADRSYYLRRARAFWNMRELLATLVAFWELHFTRPLPVLGEPEPIFNSSRDAVNAQGEIKAQSLQLYEEEL